jgi:P27 family predicted phage terminase small subunit
MSRSLAIRGTASRLPSCPEHLNAPAAKEWRRIARALHGMGVIGTFDRAALAAYCQAYGRWVEAEERLRETPMLFKTPSGYVQQSPWLGIINKQLELMGRYMVELGLTPAARSKIGVVAEAQAPQPMQITRIILTPGEPGQPPTREAYRRPKFAGNEADDV